MSYRYFRYPRFTEEEFRRLEKLASDIANDPKASKLPNEVTGQPIFDDADVDAPRKKIDYSKPPPTQYLGCDPQIALELKRIADVLEKIEERTR